MTLPNLPHWFTELLDADERIIWSGKPAFIPFAFGTSSLALFAITLQYAALVLWWPWGEDGILNQWWLERFIQFWPLLALPPGLLYLKWVHRNTFYACTNKRFMCSRGAMGTDFIAMDMDAVARIDVFVTPVDRVLGVGSIRLMNSSGLPMTAPPSVAPPLAWLYGVLATFALDPPMVLRGLRDHERVAGTLRSTCTNIKTDWEHPNDRRPPTQRGHRTSLDS